MFVALRRMPNSRLHSAKLVQNLVDLFSVTFAEPPGSRFSLRDLLEGIRNRHAGMLKFKIIGTSDNIRSIQGTGLLGSVSGKERP